MRYLFLAISSFFLPLIALADVSPWTVMADATRGANTASVSIDRSSAFSFSTTLLAYTAAGGTPSEELLRSFIDSYYQANQIGDPTQINDDFWGILALRSAGVSNNEPVIQDARSFILRAQRTDGGWSWSPTYPVSDTDDTAAAVMALLESGMSAGDAALTRGLSYLRASQNSDGGFPNVPSQRRDGPSRSKASSVESTAWVVSALWKAGENPHTWMQNGNNPISYLEAQPHASGMPAVMIALAGKSYPVRSMTPTVMQKPRVTETPAYGNPAKPDPAPPGTKALRQPAEKKQSVAPKKQVKKKVVKNKVTKKPVKKEGRHSKKIVIPHTDAGSRK